MSDGFSAEHHEIARHAKRFDDHAARAESVHKELLEAVASAPWGTDAIGRAFGAAHDQQAQEVLDQIGGLHGALGEHGRKLGAAAKNYESTESDVHASMTAVDREMNG